MKSLNTLRHYGCRTLTALVALVCLAFSHSLWADNLYFVHTDHLGTPVVITDSMQTTVWKGDKTPFGETTATVNQIEFNVRFPGQYYDAELGLHYNYFRDYDPSLGRYVQSDPIGLRGGLNTYGYAYQNPISYVDPKGLNPAAAGLCFIPGVGWVGCGAAAVGVGGAALLCYLTGACQNLGKACGDAWSAWNESTDSDGGEENTNPYKGSVTEPVVVVNGNGTAIPIAEGESIGSSPDGKWQEVKDKDGNRTGTRVDGGHPKTHDDPRAQGPHGHRDGVTNSDGTPWLPW